MAGKCWGFWAHKKINYYAVFCIPDPLFYFYKPYIDVISELAVVPDKRRFNDPSEAPRHHIDLEYYFSIWKNGKLPRNEEEVKKMVPPDSITTWGRLPWAVVETYNALVKAFEAREVKNIIRLSAYLGHYVADACVPLHTTYNYNGQYTGQVGIHSLWESRVPELFGDNFDFLAGKATYINDPISFIYDIIIESHKMVDSTLQIEAQITAEFGTQSKYTYEQRGKRSYRMVSKEFALEYLRRLNNAQEKRMKRAIQAIASLWFSAWIEAGKPILTPQHIEEWEDLISTTVKDTIKKAVDRAILDFE